MLTTKSNQCGNLGRGRFGRSSTVVDIASRPADERLRIESFIKGVYQRAYGAEISVDYPYLMSVQDESGAIHAAAGFRCADTRPLFLEQYTREPAERTIARLYDESIPRTQIAEIGNLASSGNARYTMFLFSALATYLQQQGISHVMVTVTESLHKRFTRLGLHPRQVCDATAESLAGSAVDWGTYYETRPRVLAGRLTVAVDQLKAIQESVKMPFASETESPEILPLRATA